MSDLPTIAALATAPQPAGIAVVRVSGSRTRTALKAIFRGKKNPADHPRYLSFGDLIDYKNGDVIDHCMAVYMPAPFSYTGEDVGEFQFHGSPVIVERVLRSLFAYGISSAEPGEFTKRAFLNGKLDLAQAEAISDLINATSEEALKLAGDHLEGRFSEAINKMGEPLRDLLAEVEASIDFPEEGIEPQKLSEMLTVINQSATEIGKLLGSYKFGAAIKDGYKVLLCGRPNVGKSSLLNQLLGQERAIVTEIAGTTRDLIEEQAYIGGLRFTFCDSAGIVEETSDKVEEIGIELALAKTSWADLVLFIVDATDKDQYWIEVLDYLKTRAKMIWMVVNKIDLNPTVIGRIYADASVCAQVFYISAKTISGLDALKQGLIDQVKRTNINQGEASQVVTTERHKNCLERATNALQKAAMLLTKNEPLEIVSAELREALTSLEEIVGKTYNEDILRRIFSKFCIGK